jgi:hypothetical protein
MEIKESDTKQEQDVTSLIESYTKSAEQTDTVIQQSLAFQDDKLKQRMQQRSTLSS